MGIERREIPPTGILQEWVAKLGLRQQGVLLTAVRGCDTAPKRDPSKQLSRAIRGMILNTHCKNPEDARSFIEVCSKGELYRRMGMFANDCDHYPHHFIMHILHASEIIGYCHPVHEDSVVWLEFYNKLCWGLHLTPETCREMNIRLNAEEEAFGDAN